jgi:MFS family permease
VHGLIPPLGPRAWRFVGGFALSELGTGLTWPFLIVYLHDVRGLSVGTSGLVIAAISVAGMAFAPPAGALADRVGAEPVLVAAALVAAAGTAAFAFVHSARAAFAAALVFGAGVHVTWAMTNTILAVVVEPALRGAVYAVNYATLNLALGLGGVLAGLVVDVERAWTFQVVFLADAATFLLFLLFVPRGVHTASAGSSTVGYRAVLRDRVLVGASLLNLSFVAFGLSQLSAGFPAYATGPADVSTRVVGFAFLANTWAIASLQLVVLREIAGRRRTHAAALAGAVIAFAWLLTVAGGSASGALAITLLIAAPGVVGVAETLLSPTLIAIVHDVAPDELRGRYNAVYNFSWQLGPVLGPALAGFAIGAGHGDALFLGLAGACVATSALALRFGRIVPRDADTA